MKLSDVHPIYKKGKTDPTKMSNYRPISVLPTPSKIFERILHDQIAKYFEKYLSKYLCGYRAGFSTQHALIVMIEKWKAILDKKGFAGAVLMDLSKAFDCLDHSL